MKNNLKKILEKRGFSKVVLTQECLVNTGLYTMHRFNKVLNNEGEELKLSEISGLANWLGIDMKELEQPNPKSRKPESIHEQAGQ